MLGRNEELIVLYRVIVLYVIEFGCCGIKRCSMYFLYVKDGCVFICVVFRNIFNS